MSDKKEERYRIIKIGNLYYLMYNTDQIVGFKFIKCWRYFENLPAYDTPESAEEALKQFMYEEAEIVKTFDANGNII